MSFGDENTVTVKGPQGELARSLPAMITVRQDGDILIVERPDDQRQNRALHGLTRSLVANMVSGVTEGFSKELEIVGVGYRAQSRGPSSLELALGFSHPVPVTAPDGVTFEVPTPTRIVVRGIDKEKVGQWPPTSASCESPSPTKARGSAIPASGSCARPERQPSMGRTAHKLELRRRRHSRVRRRVVGTTERPRLSVFRSNKHISAQLIDDTSGRTVAAASSVEESLRDNGRGQRGRGQGGRRPHRHSGQRGRHHERGL